MFHFRQLLLGADVTGILAVCHFRCLFSVLEPL